MSVRKDSMIPPSKGRSLPVATRDDIFSLSARIRRGTINVDTRDTGVHISRYMKIKGLNGSEKGLIVFWEDEWGWIVVDVVYDCVDSICELSLKGCR